MNYASAIHQCRTAVERKRALQVAKELDYADIASAEAFAVVLQSKLIELGLDAAQVHPVDASGRVDVIVGTRTIMSWTPTLN